MTYVHEIPGVPTRNSELVDAPDGVRMAFSHVIVDGHDVLLAASENGWWSQSLSGEYEPAPQPVPRTVTIRVDETLTVTPRPLACTSNDQIVVNNLASSAVAVEWGLQNDAGYLPGVVNCQQGVLVVRAQPPRNAYDYNAALRECEETVRSWYFREPNSGECEALASQSAPIPAPLEVRVPIEARTITLGHQVVATLDLGTGIERTILGWCSRDSVADSMLFVTATASGTPTRAFRYNPTADSFAVESLDSVTCNEPMAD